MRATTCAGIVLRLAFGVLASAPGGSFGRCRATFGRRPPPSRAVNRQGTLLRSTTTANKPVVNLSRAKDAVRSSLPSSIGYRAMSTTSAA